MPAVMADSIPPPLSQGAGYGVIVGLGVAFALGTNNILYVSLHLQ
jgi:hypothetical protein